MFFRSIRRVLTPSSCKAVPSVPWVFPRSSQIQVQGNPKRTQRSPQSILQTGQHSGKTAPTEGSEPGGLSGRLAHLGQVRPGMHSSSQPDCRFPSGARLLHQLGEIVPSTHTTLPVARPPLESDGLHTQHSPIQMHPDSMSDAEILRVSEGFQEDARKSMDPYYSQQLPLNASEMLSGWPQRSSSPASTPGNRHPHSPERSH